MDDDKAKTPKVDNPAPPVVVDPDIDVPPLEPPVLVRVVPGDWTVDSVSFTTGDGPDAVEHLVTAAKPGNVPYLVGADEVDAVIAAAAARGLAVTKEQSA